jgi:hypothetical protein
MNTFKRNVLILTLLTITITIVGAKTPDELLLRYYPEVASFLSDSSFPSREHKAELALEKTTQQNVLNSQPTLQAKVIERENAASSELELLKPMLSGLGLKSPSFAVSASEVPTKSRNSYTQKIGRLAQGILSSSRKRAALLGFAIAGIALRSTIKNVIEQSRKDNSQNASKLLAKEISNSGGEKLMIALKKTLNESSLVRDTLSVLIVDSISSVTQTALQRIAKFAV